MVAVVAVVVVNIVVVVVVIAVVVVIVIVVVVDIAVAAVVVVVIIIILFSSVTAKHLQNENRGPSFKICRLCVTTYLLIPTTTIHEPTFVKNCDLVGS